MVAKAITAIDTNIFISVINKEPGYEQSTKKILDWIDAGILRAILSTVVLAEICSGYDITHEEDDERDSSTKERDDFLAHILSSPNYEIADVTVPIALDAGNLRGREGFKLPDALIIASALRHGAEYLISNDEISGRSRRSTAVLSDSLTLLSANEFVKRFERAK
jgi:predicted nucleic acid-binding protein